MLKKIFLIIIAVCFSLAAFSQSARKNKLQKLYPLTIAFQNQVGNQLLALDSTYTNPYGETFQVRNFRYYIHHISVESKTSTAPFPATYFLIDERKPESKTIVLKIPYRQITSLNFFVGVDSSKNVSGVQTGALDPANGMFWAWNSGYIFAKLEGSSPQSNAPQQGFTYHIGGFRSGEKAIRFVKLPVSNNLSAGNATTLTIAANINAWFAGSTAIKIAEMPSVMTPGPQAMQVADNYSKMFSILPLN